MPVALATIDPVVSAARMRSGVICAEQRAIGRAQVGGVAAMALRATRLEQRHHLQDLRGRDRGHANDSNSRKTTRLRFMGSYPAGPLAIRWPAILCHLYGVLADIDENAVTVFDVAEEQQIRERLLDRLLDQPGHRPRAERAIEALAAPARPAPRASSSMVIFRPATSCAQLVDVLVDDALDLRRAERA